MYGWGAKTEGRRRYSWGRVGASRSLAVKPRAQQVKRVRCSQRRRRGAYSRSSVGDGGATLEWRSREIRVSLPRAPLLARTGGSPLAGHCRFRQSAVMSTDRRRKTKSRKLRKQLCARVGGRGGRTGVWTAVESRRAGGHFCVRGALIAQ